MPTGKQLFEEAVLYEREGMFAAAVELYTKAATAQVQPSRPAAWHLGFMHQQGIGTKKDPEAAALYWRLAHKLEK